MRSTSVLLLGPAGTGKTHLFTRLRRQAGAKAVFVLSRPEIGAEPSSRHVLAAIVDSLRRPVAGGEHRQIDVITGALLAAVEGEKTHYPLSLIEERRRLSPEARRDLFERVVAATEDRFADISPQYLERLLAVPFADRQDQRALLAWLSGREPSPVELERAGASGALGDLDVLPALRTLGVAAAIGAPIVLVFDQLENLAEEAHKTGRILAHARLVSELRDTVRGLLIVQMALDSEWATRIHPILHGSDRARLEETVQHLDLPRREERRELLHRWWEALPEDARGGPFPAPFSPAQIDAWTRDAGMTPRMLMQAAGEAYRSATSPAGAPAEAPIPAPSPEERLQIHWESAIARARAEIDDAAEQQRGVGPERILGGLLAALDLAGAETGAPEARPSPSARVRTQGGAARIVVAQNAHPRSLAAVIKAATALAAEGRVLLLREHALGIAPTWKEAHRLLAAFTATAGASFATLDRDTVARLLALADFLTAARSQDLSADDGRPIPHEDAIRWAAQALGSASWAPLSAVLAPARPRSTHPAPPVTSPAPEPRAAPATGPLRAILDRLRLASIDRLVREAKAVDPASTRATVIQELARLPVRIFGGSIVALEDR